MTRTATIEDRLVHVSSRLGDLYSHLLLPSNARDCVVICSSILGEFEANYHRERLLARALADSSIAVARFHYAGEGNSSGNRDSLTLTSMIEGAQNVASHIAALGYERRAYVGTRVGCLVAASVATSDGNAPLVLWEPVEHGLDFIRDAERKRRMSGLAHAAAPTRRERASEGDEDLVELFGYDVHSSLLEDLEKANLLETLATPGPSIFLGRFGRPDQTHRIAERLRATGFSVESTAFGLAEAWWYQSEREPDSGDLIAATAAWIASVMEKPA